MSSDQRAARATATAALAALTLGATGVAVVLALVGTHLARPLLDGAPAPLETVGVDGLVGLVVVAAGAVAALRLALHGALGTVAVLVAGAARPRRATERAGAGVLRRLALERGPVVVRTLVRRGIGAGVGAGIAAGLAVSGAVAAPLPAADHVPAAVQVVGSQVAQDAAQEAGRDAQTGADAARSATTVHLDLGWQPSVAGSTRTASAAADADTARTTARTTGTTDDRHVVVHRGDSLWTIAARHLGPDATDVDVARAWPRWYQANRAAIGADPDLILPGTVLVAPADE